MSSKTITTLKVVLVGLVGVLGAIIPALHPYQQAIVGGITAIAALAVAISDGVHELAKAHAKRQ